MSRSTIAPRMLGVLSTVQHVHNGSYGVVSGTAAIPFDATIPQITEGFEVMTLSITPRFATSTLRIEAGVQCWDGGATEQVEACLFRDSTANALTVSGSPQVTASGGNFHTIRWEELAGSTAPTTYRIRIGGNGGTIYFNDRSAAGIFAGKLNSYMTIWEIAA